MRNSVLMVMALMFGLAAVLPQSITAQQEESDAQDSDDKQFRGPLPFYFGKLGLNERQKLKLYEIQESYEEQIAKLRKQIEELEQQRDKSMETLLTPGQKLRLKELRDEARRKEEARLKTEESDREQQGATAAEDDGAT